MGVAIDPQRSKGLKRDAEVGWVGEAEGFIERHLSGLGSAFGFLP